MSFQIEPLDSKQAQFAVRITGVDIASGVSERVTKLIEKAMDH